MKLTINEKDYNLVWGLPAISQFCENIGVPDDLDMAFTIAFPVEGSDIKPLRSSKARLELIYAAIQVGAELSKKDLDLSIIELQAFIDNADQKIVEDIFEDFFKSKFMGNSIQDFLFESVNDEEAPKEEKSVKKSRRAS